MATNISLQDYLEICNVAFEWVASYDTKDWERLKKILAPSIRLDFRSLQGELHEGLDPDRYANIISGMIGDKRMMTQHLLGGSKIESLDDGSVRAWHQLRVAHQRYAKEDLAEVVNRGHGYGVAQHWYRKIDGVWKIEAVEPKLDWAEHDLYGTLAPHPY